MKSIDSHLDKTDVNTEMNIFLPFREYQYHFLDSEPSVPLQYIHIFTVPLMVNAVGSDRSSEPIIISTNLEIMATQPHTDSSSNKNSDNKSDSMEEDRNDVIDDVEMEGNRLDDATLVNPCNKTLQPGAGSSHERT